MSDCECTCGRCCCDRSDGQSDVVLRLARQGDPALTNLIARMVRTGKLRPGDLC